MVSEFGWWTGPGPLRVTCGPLELLPLTETVTGQPGTDILLNETEMMWSQGSVGTKETANLQAADGSDFRHNKSNRM